MSQRRCAARVWWMIVVAGSSLCAGVWAAPPMGEPREGTPVAVPAEAHDEHPDDAPVAVTERPIERARPAVIERNGFYSVQVNVDAAGNNIVGDAANEPSLAVDPTNPDRMVIGWRQFDSIASNFREAGWAYTQDGGQTWTFPGVLEDEMFRSDPVLEADAEGNIFYYSLRGDMVCHMFVSTDGGQTWGAPVEAFGGDKQWMAIDRTGGMGDGYVYAAWSPTVSPWSDTPFTRSRDGGQTWDGPYALPGIPQFGTIDVGPDGTVYIAGWAAPYSLCDFVVARSMNVQNEEENPAFTASYLNLQGCIALSNGPNPGGLIGQVCVATDHSDGPTAGNVYVLCSVNPFTGDYADVMFVRSEDGGENWSFPQRVNDDVDPEGDNWQWFGEISVAPNGRIDVIWNDTRQRDSVRWSEVYYSYSFDGGESWSPGVPVTPAFNSFRGWPQQNKLGDYYEMVSDDVQANLAYAATFNNEQDVYFVQLGDCNGNGVHDSEDVTAGVSDDLNGNWLPDECEPDCNGNLIPDDWDLLQGTSLDCNGNEVPDECDIAAGEEVDCNANGVPDSCDLEMGTSADCNLNVVPDECDIALGVAFDCNSNGVPDACDIGTGASVDCDADGVPDECELAAGEADCNNNGVLDACEFALDVVIPSVRFTPLGEEIAQTLVLENVRYAESAGAVVLDFEAYGDLNQGVEIVDLYVNDEWVDELFGDDVPTVDCPTGAPTAEQTVLTAAQWNTAVESGQVAIKMVPASYVTADECSPYTWISVEVRYVAEPLSEDCNTNAVPDACDIAGGTSADENGNGIPDECESVCRGDCNGDGVIDELDIPYFVAALHGRDAWVERHLDETGTPPTALFANCDVNADGGVTFADIVPFADRMGTACNEVPG